MKIILFANTDWYLYNYRLPLADGLLKSGHSVVLLSPGGKYARRMEEAGYDWREVDLSRRGFNPINEIRTIVRLMQIYRSEHPDVVHHFTIKCVLYGSFSARQTKLPRVVNAVTGLGYLFTNRNLFTLLAKPLVLLFYRLILKGTQVIFQNEVDRDYFLEKKLASKEQCSLIPGSGVDTGRFKPAPQKRKKGLIVLPARMLWDKGVGEFVEAAAFLRKSDCPARFALVGDVDEGNPSSIPVEKLKQWQREGLVEWWGWQDDMVSVYQSADIVCLPSYREGLAKSLIEAAACGCPLVASDIPGCREVVEQGVNGLLVPKGDAHALARALIESLSNRNKLEKMGRASRQTAVRKFSIDQIVSATISIYNI